MSGSLDDYVPSVAVAVLLRLAAANFEGDETLGITRALVAVLAAETGYRYEVAELSALAVKLIHARRVEWMGDPE